MRTLQIRETVTILKVDFPVDACQTSAGKSDNVIRDEERVLLEQNKTRETTHNKRNPNRQRNSTPVLSTKTRNRAATVCSVILCERQRPNPPFHVTNSKAGPSVTELQPQTTVGHRNLPQRSDFRVLDAMQKHVPCSCTMPRTINAHAQPPVAQSSDHAVPE